MAISGSFTGTGASADTGFRSAFLLSLSSLTAGSGTVQLQRRVDGTNWRTIEEFTADAERVVDVGGGQGRVPHRLNCSAYSSGTFAYWMGLTSEAS